MCVDAEGGVELTAIPDGAINHVRCAGVIHRVHVRFHRHQQLARRVRERAEQSLAAGGHDIVASDRSCGTDEMLEFLSSHATSLTISRILRRSGSLSEPANGED